MSENTPENPYPQAPAAPTAPVAPPAPYGSAPYGNAPYGNQGGPAAVDPGKTMSIIAIILPFVGFGLVGLILGIIAKSKSKKAGYKNTLALVAIIVSILAILTTIIVSIIFIVAAVNVSNEIMEACQNGAESIRVNGEVVSCSGIS